MTAPTEAKLCKLYSEALFNVWMSQESFGIPVLKIIKETLGEEGFFQFLKDHQTKTITNRSDIPEPDEDNEYGQCNQQYERKWHLRIDH